MTTDTSSGTQCSQRGKTMHWLFVLLWIINTNPIWLKEITVFSFPKMAWGYTVKWQVCPTVSAEWEYSKSNFKSLLLLHRKSGRASSLHDYFLNFMDREVVPQLTVRFQSETLTFYTEFRGYPSSKYWLIFQKQKMAPFSLFILWILSKNHHVLYIS